MKLLTGDKWDRFVLREKENRAHLEINAKRAAGHVVKLDKSSAFPNWLRVYAENTVEMTLDEEICPVIHIFPDSDLNHSYQTSK